MAINYYTQDNIKRVDTYKTFVGGQNTNSSDDNLLEYEFPILENVFLDDIGSATKRPGIKPLFKLDSASYSLIDLVPKSGDGTISYGVIQGKNVQGVWVRSLVLINEANKSFDIVNAIGQKINSNGSLGDEFNVDVTWTSNNTNDINVEKDYSYFEGSDGLYLKAPGQYVKLPRDNSVWEVVTPTKPTGGDLETFGHNMYYGGYLGQTGSRMDDSPSINDLATIEKVTVRQVDVVGIDEDSSLDAFESIIPMQYNAKVGQSLTFRTGIISENLDPDYTYNWALYVNGVSEENRVSLDQSTLDYFNSSGEEVGTGNGEELTLTLSFKGTSGSTTQTFTLDKSFLEQQDGTTHIRNVSFVGRDGETLVITGNSAFEADFSAEADFNYIGNNPDNPPSSMDIRLTKNANSPWTTVNSITSIDPTTPSYVPHTFHDTKPYILVVERIDLSDNSSTIVRQYSIFPTSLDFEIEASFYKSLWTNDGLIYNNQCVFYGPQYKLNETGDSNRYESGNTYNIWFSKVNDFGNFPRFNRVDVKLPADDEIVKLQPFNDVLLVFTKRKIYFISGSTPLDFSLRLLNDSIGSIAKESIYPVGNYVFFLSEDGLYFLKSLNYGLEERFNVDSVDSAIKNQTTSSGDENKYAKAIVHEQNYYLYLPKGNKIIKYSNILNSWEGNITSSLINGDINTMFNIRPQYNVAFIANGTIYELTKEQYFDGYEDNKQLYETIIKTKGHDSGLTHHTKKYKELQIRTIVGGAKSELFISAYSDGYKILDTLQPIAFKNDDGKWMYKMEQVANASINPGSYLDTTAEFDTSTWGSAETNWHRVRIPSTKGKKFALEISQKDDAFFGVLSYGFILKYRKPK